MLSAPQSIWIDCPRLPFLPGFCPRWFSLQARLPPLPFSPAGPRPASAARPQLCPGLLIRPLSDTVLNLRLGQLLLHSQPFRPPAPAGFQGFRPDMHGPALLLQIHPVYEAWGFHTDTHPGKFRRTGKSPGLQSSWRCCVYIPPQPDGSLSPLQRK